MIKKIKTGLLIFLLGGPVFLLSFLYVFGENEYDLPIYLCETEPCYRVDQYQLDSLLGEPNKQYKATVVSLLSNEKAEFRLKEINDKDYSFYKLSHANSKHFYKVFRVKDQKEVVSPNAVLLDQNLQIRGYYNLTIMEEVDRMIKEVGVLLNQ